MAGVGEGPAGLACATSAAERGHHVTLFDAADDIGGHFNLAKTIPGKEEFHETLRYFRHRIDETGVELRLSTRATPELLSGFDQVVLATGVPPRRVDSPGPDPPKVVGYLDVLHRRVLIGGAVALLGPRRLGFPRGQFPVPVR